MLNFIDKKSNKSYANKNLNFHKKPSNNLINFCNKMGEVIEIKDYLVSLKAHIPKKFKIGELLLFYNSEELGLRRAYIRNSIFYEEKVKKQWSSTESIGFCSTKQSLYLAEECGRLFPKSLVVPISQFESESSSLLFVEVGKEEGISMPLVDFFEERATILRLIFKRVLLNSRWTRIPYLWSQLFTHWREPLAILKDFQAIRLNEAFKKNLSNEDIFKQKNIPNFIETKKKTYQIHYYPIYQLKGLSATGILYCQDMTKHFDLKKQLFQNQKMTSLYELGKNIAHQLNNPLTGVRAMAQFLYQEPSLKQFSEEFIEVEKAVTRSQKIIEKLLSFSQLTEKQETCDLNQVIQDTLPLLQSISYDLNLKIELSKQAIKVKGDFTILQQTAYNLILNACQALKDTKIERKPLIQISTNKKSKSIACLKVTDNGPGIAPQNLEKVFQPLWTSKTKDKGTGFGLGISRKFIQKLGGDISVFSKENEITCFTVLLPLNQS